MVTQRQAWVVEMRDDGVTGEVETFGKARAVTRVATHLMGDVAPRSVGVHDYFDRYTCLVPRAGSKSNREMDGEPDGHDLYNFWYNPQEDYSNTSAQSEPIVSAGVPAMYDGDRLFEYGTHYLPFIVAQETEEGGSLALTGAYQWQIVYEWHDHRGRLHSSPPSAIFSHTMTGTHNAMRLRIATLQLTERQDIENGRQRVEIVIYRTTDGGDTFFRSGVVMNDMSVPWVEYLDDVDDTVISERNIIYTDGGVLIDWQPPSTRHITYHDSRLWAISRDEPTMLWVSKIVQPGFAVPGFPLEFVMQHEAGGGFVGLAPLGAQLLALKENGVYAYGGSAPNDLGQQGTISGPATIAKHTGCVNPKSICATPAGVAFQSKESIWMVDRSFQVTRIGAPVEDLLAEYPVCAQTVLDQRRELLYFFMNKGAYHGWLELDGTDDYVDHGAPAALNFERTDSWTFAAWVRDDLDAVQRALFSKRESGGLLRGYVMYRLENGTYKLFVRDDTLLTHDCRSTAIPAGWHLMIVRVTSMAAGATSIWINGADATASATGTLNSSIQGTGSFLVGRFSIHYHSGDIGTYGVWDRVLTDEECAALYAAGRDGDWSSTDPLLYCNPARDVYPVIEDYGSGGNDGLLVNMHGEDLVRERVVGDTAVLCWHYNIGQWTTWKMPSEVSGADFCTRPSLGRDELTMVMPDVGVTHLDNGFQDWDGTTPHMVVATPWLQFSGFAGFQRVRRYHIRGTHLGKHRLRVRICYNFVETDYDEYTLEASEVEALLDGNEEHIRFRVPRQKCKAIRIYATALPAIPVGYLRCDGANDYVDHGAPAALNFERTDDFTVAVWFRTTNVANWAHLISKRESATQVGWYIEKNYASTALAVALRSATQQHYSYVGGAFADGEFHLLVWRFTAGPAGVGGTSQIDVDGTSLTVVAIHNSLATETTQGAGIVSAGSRNGVASFFPGDIGPYGVWDRILTDEECAALYARGMDGDWSWTSPLLYCQPGLGTYPTIEDRGSGGNDGTMTNMAVSSLVQEHTGDGNSVRWETIAFEVAGKKGLFKLPEGASR